MKHQRAAEIGNASGEPLRTNPERGQLTKIVAALEWEAFAVILDTQHHDAAIHMNADTDQRRRGMNRGVDGRLLQQGMNRIGEIGSETVSRFGIGEVDGDGQGIVTFEALAKCGEAKAKTGGAETRQPQAGAGRTIENGIDAPCIHVFSLLQCN